MSQEMTDKIDLLVLMVYVLGMMIIGCLTILSSTLKTYVSSAPQVNKKQLEAVKTFNLIINCFWLIWWIGVGALMYCQQHGLITW